MLKEPTIKEACAFKMIGMNFFGNPFVHANMWSEENGIGQLWSRFGKWLHSNFKVIENPENTSVAYEVHIESDQMETTGEYEVFTGIAVKNLDHIPIECVGKVFPKTQYAEFTLEGDEITSDWTQWIFEGWMPHSGYMSSAPYSIQVYDESFKGMDALDGVQIKVLIPIKKVGDDK
ncbi:GyrI-like domain-containing protein [Fusibacter sp. JL216-2]|uniref:GyrI-like domain-containing protein n=1 Tax=Fusibacter sp. JL216-2 TaxID=3071453 RepID=UPI003D33DBBF